MFRKHRIILRRFVVNALPRGTTISNAIPNYNQKDATILDLFISTDALHVSGGSSAHHQEHITVYTASNIVNLCSLLSWMRWDEFHLIHDSSKQQYWLTIPEAVCTVMCSWWWAEEPAETCRASVEINQEMLQPVGCNLDLSLPCTDIWISNFWITHITGRLQLEKLVNDWLETACLLFYAAICLHGQSRQIKILTEAFSCLTHRFRTEISKLYVRSTHFYITLFEAVGFAVFSRNLCQ